jgi:uncharacterized RDD family membrane protein YckC
MWRRRIRAVSLYTSGDQALGQSLLDQERGSLPIGEQSWNDLVLLMLYRYSSNWKSVIDIGEKIKAWPVKKGWPDLVRFYVARAYAQQGKLSKACEELDSIKGPYNARLLDVGLAGIRAVAGSQPALDRCLERTKLPEWNQLFLRGICLGTMGQVEDAKALLTRALDLAAQQPKLSAAWTQFIKSELKQLEGRNADTPVPDYSVEQARIEETYKRLLNALPTQLGAGTTVRSTTGGTTSAEPQTEEVLLPYAGFRLRFAAMAADGVLATLAGLCLILIPISWTNPQADWREVGKLLAGAYTKQGGVLAMGLSVLAVYAFGCCLCGVLVPLFESSRWQTTPGKWLFNLKVTDNNGRRIGIHKAYIKQILQGTFAGIFSILWPVYPATYLPIWSTRKQTLYDRILGRVVVIQYEQPSMFKKCIRTVALLAGLALSVLSVVWAYAAIQEIDQLTSSRPDHPHALTKQEGSAHTLK